MTRSVEIEVSCYVCDTKSIHRDVSSTNSNGMPDLDMRPAPMLGSTIIHWIQRCPECGYCSASLSAGSSTSRGIVESEEYQNIIGNREIPEAVASFLALSYDNQQRNDLSNAAWAVIHAVWICDDAKLPDVADEYRKQAVSLIELANSEGQKLAEQVGVSETITIDLMRRTGMFKEALALISTMKAIETPDMIPQILEYQEALVRDEDVGLHTIAEAVGEDPFPFKFVR